MEKVLHLDKLVGETPLACIERFRAQHSEYENAPMTYAGRLDPLASGALLVLVGDECKQKAAYLGKDKTYEIKVLFGVATDTHDILGKITSQAHIENFPETANEIAKSFVGTFEQKYPAFSSKTIDGKAMFDHAKEGTLPDEEDIPTKTVTIYSIKNIQREDISKTDLQHYVMGTIALVSGDFRQEEIARGWKNFFDTVPDGQNFYVLQLTVDCSSGTYMRSLANEIGKKLGIPALALAIHRTRIAP